MYKNKVHLAKVYSAKNLVRMWWRNNEISTEERDSMLSVLRRAAKAEMALEALGVIMDD